MATAKKKVVPAKKIASKKTEAAPAKKRVGFGGARKPGSKPAVKRKPLPTFKAPADFKPHFLLVTVATEADGLLGNKVKAVRYLGKFSREAEDKKKSDMASYDMLTVAGIMARLSGKTFKPTNDKKYSADIKQRNTGGKAKINGVVKEFKSTGPDGKPLIGSARLPKNTTFQLLMRVGRRTADNTLTCTIRQVFQVVTMKSGRVGPKELEKTDPVYRVLRGCGRFMPAAFTKVQMPPKRTRRRAADIEGEEE
jgi:hypothetical protein